MRTVLFKSSTVALIAMLALSACSNNKRDLDALNVLKSPFTKSQKAAPPDQQAIAQSLTRALTKTDGPLALLHLKKTETITVLRQIETNGPYRTWAAYGTSDRRSLTTKGGLITATRGLGFDLMSSDINGVLPLITRRQNGTAKRIQRYLNGENAIYELVADCTVSRGPAQVLKVANSNQSATQMNVSCSTGEHDFTNTYLVNSGGKIVQARQWLGPVYGHAFIQHVR